MKVFTITEIYKDISGFEKRNDCYKDEPLVRFAFAAEELGELAHELNRGKVNNGAVATECFDAMWNLCGVMRSLGISPEEFAAHARAKMEKNKTRKFPTH